MHQSYLLPIVLLALTSEVLATDLDWVRVGDDGKSFSLASSGKPFVPWGFNYDHEGDGRLLEDYWDDHWNVVESAFKEMKQLGAQRRPHSSAVRQVYESR